MLGAIISAFINLFTITALNPHIRIAKEKAILHGADSFAVDQFWLIFDVALTLGICVIVYFCIAVYQTVSSQREY